MIIKYCIYYNSLDPDLHPKLKSSKMFKILKGCQRNRQ